MTSETSLWIAVLIFCALAVYDTWVFRRARKLQRVTQDMLDTCTSLGLKIQVVIREENEKQYALREALIECASPFEFDWRDGGADTFATELNRRQRVAAKALGKPVLGTDDPRPANPSFTTPTVVT